MEENLTQEFLDISNRINELTGANAKNFVVHCGRSVKKVIGSKFQIESYSYEVISTDTVLETEKEDGSFQSDIWITIKE